MGWLAMAQTICAMKKTLVFLFLTASSATAFYLAVAVGWWTFWW
jgi:hypothetical protein